MGLQTGYKLNDSSTENGGQRSPKYHQWYVDHHLRTISQAFEHLIINVLVKKKNEITAGWTLLFLIFTTFLKNIRGFLFPDRQQMSQLDYWTETGAFSSSELTDMKVSSV